MVWKVRSRSSYSVATTFVGWRPSVASPNRTSVRLRFSSYSYSVVMNSDSGSPSHVGSSGGHGIAPVYSPDSSHLRTS